MKRIFQMMAPLLAMTQIGMAQDPVATAFLKVDGVTGQSEAPDRTGWIDVELFDFQAERRPADGPFPGTIWYTDMDVVARLESSAQAIFDNMVDGQVIRNAEIERTAEFDGRQREVVEEWTLKNALVTGFERSNSSTIDYSLAFEDGEFCYVERRLDGTEWARRCTEFQAAGHRDTTLEDEEEDEDNPSADEVHTNFLDLDGISGQSEAPNRTGSIDVDSFTFDAGRSLTDGRFSGTVLYSGMDVIARFDRAAQMVFDKMVTGQVIANATVARTEAFQNDRREAVEEWTLENVLVTSFERTNDSTVSYSLAFEKGQLCNIDRSETGNQTGRQCTQFEPASQVTVELQAGDADQDLDFDQLDLVRVQVAAKYLTNQAATWGDGDWNGAPGGSQGSPPAGDSRFNQLDIIAALNANTYLTGPYGAVLQNGSRGDDQTSIGYDANTGELFVDAPAGTELTSINVDSAAGIFTGDPAENLGGSFDNDADDNIFKATFGGSFGSISFGHVAQTGLSRANVLADLTVVGSLAGGGSLGDVDLIYVPVPEPSSLVLAGLGLLALVLCVRRRRVP